MEQFEGLDRDILKAGDTRKKAATLSFLLPIDSGGIYCVLGGDIEGAAVYVGGTGLVVIGIWAAV